MLRLAQPCAHDGASELAAMGHPIEQCPVAGSHGLSSQHLDERPGDRGGRVRDRLYDWLACERGENDPAALTQGGQAEGRAHGEVAPASVRRR